MDGAHPLAYDLPRGAARHPAGLAEMPNPNRSAEGYIIDKELDVLSSRQDERRIAALMPVIDDMLDRCEETVRHTSRVLLRWLRSTRPQECSSKPFTLVAPRAKQAEVSSHI